MVSSVPRNAEIFSSNCLWSVWVPQMKRTEAIIRSMTPGERENPQIINGSRRSRIAKGSGTQVQDVNRLVKQFGEMQKMIKQQFGGRLPPR